MKSFLEITKHIFDNLVIESSNNNTDDITWARLRIILNYIDTNYNSKITLEDISKQVNLCETECSRFFKRKMNISLFEYIGEYRIKKGAEILRSTSIPIFSISEMVGFNDANNFSRTFHKVMGLSPKDYRKYYQA